MNQDDFDIRAAYDQLSTLYNRFFPPPTGTEIGFWRKIVRERSTLEIGCGTGRLTEELIDDAFGVVGVDLSRGMLSVAQGRLGRRRADFVCADMRSLPLESGSFDAVVMPRGALTHLLQAPDRLRAMREVQRVLSPDGIVAIDLPNAAKMVNSLGRRGRRHLSVRGFSDDGVAASSPLLLFSQLRTNDARTILQSAYTILHGKYWRSMTRVTFNTYVMLSAEMMALLEACGLRLVSVFGDYTESAFDDASSRRLVVVANAVH